MTSLLSLAGIQKSFGGVRALDDASFELAAPGSIHALLGANGSGKSTLLKVATGQLQPDAGRLALDGETTYLSGPWEALRRGIATVSQETSLAHDLTVVENVLMGRLPRNRLGRIDWRRARSRVAGILAALDLDLPLDTEVGRLRSDQKQLVEIARAISGDLRILVLDEATSALGDREVGVLFETIRSACTQGMACVFVSHRLDEVFELAEDITVLRDGRTVAVRRIAETTRDEIVADMTDEAPASRVPVARRLRADAPEALVLERVSSSTGLRAVDLSLRQGEIVALVGLTGAGTEELLEVVYGSTPLSSGRVIVNGAEGRSNPAAAIRRGMAFVPSDRKGRGALLTMSVRQNLSMSATCRRPRVAKPDSRREYAATEELGRRLRLRTASPDAWVGSLSGGNQQKVVLGKWLISGARLLLLAEPTRGVDIAARNDIHDALRALADGGGTVLFTSTDLDEVMELADRVVVMFRGQVVADRSASGISVAQINALASGHNDEGTAA